MSKILYAGAFLLLIFAVLVSCSTFEVDFKPGQKQHHRQHRGNNKNEQQRQQQQQQQRQKHHHHVNTKHQQEHHIKIDERFKEFSVMDRVSKQHPQQVVVNNGWMNASNVGAAPTAVGIAVTFNPNFFKNMFNVLVMPAVREVAMSLQIPDFTHGLPGPGGQFQLNGARIDQFNIGIANLQPQYPNLFYWEFDQIDLAVSGSWHVRWQIKLCPCFGGCCFHITLLSCGGSVSVVGENIQISGTMQFSLNGDTVQVSSPSQANWQGVPQVNINGHCGWFFDVILSILKFFGLNIWGMLQDIINAAIKKTVQGGLLGSAVNNFFDQTLNKALNGIHICDYAFYQNQPFMSIFTHENADPSSPCMNTLLPEKWLSTAPQYDITLLARLELLPDFLHPTNWTLICLPLPTTWFALPGSLGDEMKIEQVTTCVGLDNVLGVYLVGQVDVNFFVSEEQENLLADRAAIFYQQQSVRLEDAHKQQIERQVTELLYNKQQVQKEKEQCAIRNSFLGQLFMPSSSSSDSINHKKHSDNEEKQQQLPPWWFCSPSLVKKIEALASVSPLLVVWTIILVLFVRLLIKRKSIAASASPLNKQVSQIEGEDDKEMMNLVRNF